MSESRHKQPLAPEEPCIFLYDSRRGLQEGREKERIIAFAPLTTPLQDQISVTGLFQGLVQFVTTFTTDIPWDSGDTDTSVWTLFQAEPFIWFAVTAPKSWLPRHSTHAALKGILLHTYQLAQLLRGPIENLLNSDPTNLEATHSLNYLLEYVRQRLLITGSYEQRELRNPLGQLGLLPRLLSAPGGHGSAVSIAQALCNRITEEGGAVGAMIFYQGVAIWTTLMPSDGAMIHGLIATLSCHAAWPPPAGGLQQRSTAIKDENVLNPMAWLQFPGGLLFPISSSPGCKAPLINLSNAGQHRLMLMIKGKLLIVAIMKSDMDMSTPENQGALLMAVGDSADDVEKLLTAELKGSRGEAGHVPGFRYKVCDPDDQSCQLTPRRKISAMSHHARAVVAALDDSLDLVGGDVQDALIRSAQECWAGVRHDVLDERNMIVIRERKGEKTAADAACLLSEFADSFLP